MGEWNTMKIKVQGDEVTTWVNDIQMIFLKDAAIDSDGKIALQIHDGGGIKVVWKEIFIKEM
jgi:hypothetical protein